MKIVLICNEYPLRPHAGIGTMVQMLARALCAKGHSVTVVGLGAQDVSERDGEVKVITLKRNKIPYAGNYFSRKKLHTWLQRGVRAGEIEIVEVPDSQGLLPFPLHGCPVVVRLHLSYAAVGRVTGESVGKGIAFYERRTLALHKNWVGVSRYVYDLTRETFGLSPTTITVIPNAVTPPSPSATHQPTFTLPKKFVLYAGHVCYRKGADALAEAMKSLMIRDPDLHLVYAGGVFTENGQLVSDEINRLIGDEQKSRVHFLGRLPREDALYCMKRAKVFAFPSRLESFGLVVVEAMSCGVPVIFTKNGPGPEIVEHGRTGLLVDPSSPDDIREKIEMILNDSALAQRLIEAAKVSVETKFSVEQCASATERFYQQCLSN